MFGLNAKAMSHLTLAKIRKVYSRADNKAIAKQLGMSSHENATPIRSVVEKKNILKLVGFLRKTHADHIGDESLELMFSNISFVLFQTEFFTIRLVT